MKTILHFKHVVIFLILSVSSSIYAQSIDDFDWEKLDKHPDFFFAPFKETNSNQGVFWFRVFSQRTLGPSNVFGLPLRTLKIRAWPHAQDNGEYSNYVQNNSIIDRRLNFFPDNAILCEPNQSLINYLSASGIEYDFKTAFGGYPSPCTLNIDYSNSISGEKEGEMVDFIKNNFVLRIWYSLEGEFFSGEYLDAPSITDSLISNNVLTESSSGSFEGSFNEIAFYSAKLKSSLFNSKYSHGDDLEFSEWMNYINLFEIKHSEDVASINQSAFSEIIELVAPGKEIFIEVDVD